MFCADVFWQKAISESNKKLDVYKQVLSLEDKPTDAGGFIEIIGIFRRS